MECWNTGIMEDWDNEMLELWIIPILMGEIFQPSISGINRMEKGQNHGRQNH
jgi:hypothetical protein